MLDGGSRDLGHLRRKLTALDEDTLVLGSSCLAHAEYNVL